MNFSSIFINIAWGEKKTLKDSYRFNLNVIQCDWVDFIEVIMYNKIQVNGE